MNFGITEKTYNLLIKTLNGYSEIEKACIFGSRTMGNYKKGSDVDICIYGKSVTEKLISELNTQLNENLPIPYYMDIVFYDNIENDNLKRHIDEQGKQLL